MSVDRDTVLRIAKLARLKVPDDSVDQLAGELNNILGWVEQLGEVNVDGVEPMASVVEMTLRCYVLGEEFEPPLPSLGRALRYWDELYL